MFDTLFSNQIKYANAAHIQLDVINLAMCKSSTFIYRFSFSLPSGRDSLSPTSASP